MAITVIPKQAVLGSSLSRGRFVVCFALISALFFLWGLSYGLLDSLNAKFQKIFGITKAESTGLQGAYFGAYFVFSFPAAYILRRIGYKGGVIFGLLLFAIGAFGFWPCAKSGTYPGFLVCTFVVACGLCTLEVAANTYVVVLAGQQHASLALTFAQGFNGISAFTGPLIASRWFFTGEHNENLDSVQFVYLSIGLFAIALAVLFLVVRFPEVKQDVSPEQEAYVREQGYFKVLRRPRLVLGFVAETLYVGAQVAVASLAINYFVETTHVSTAQAANLFSYCQMAFMAGRFISVPILHFVHPTLMLGIFGSCCCLFAILTSQVSGTAGAVMVFLVFFFESICYPVIYSQAVLGLGPYANFGGSMIAMGVAGGAWYPSAQATLADHVSTQASYGLSAVGFFSVAAYGFWLWSISCRANGFHWRTIPAEQDQTISAAEAPMRSDEEIAKGSDVQLEQAETTK